MELEKIEHQCRRERLRLCYLAAVKLTTVDGRVVRGNLRDIGVESLFVKVEKNHPYTYGGDEPVEIEMTITQGASRLTIETPGKIIREDSDGFAVIFEEPLKWWPIFSHFPVNEQFLFDIVSNT